MNPIQKTPSFTLSNETKNAFEVFSMAITPKYLWLKIFCFLETPKNVGRVSCVCKHWNFIAGEKIVWQSLIRKLWPRLSPLEFDDPKAFIRTQFRLTPQLFFKQESSGNKQFIPSKSSILLPSTPLAIGKKVFFLQNSDGSDFYYSLTQASMTIEKYRTDQAESKISILDLSFLIENKQTVSINHIRLFGDILTFHFNYSIRKPPLPTYVGSVEEENIAASLIAFVNKESFALIGHIETKWDTILDYELSENGYLRIIKKEASATIYSLVHTKPGSCIIL